MKVGYIVFLFLTACSARAAARRLCCVDIGRVKNVFAFAFVTRQSIAQLLSLVGLRGPQSPLPTFQHPHNGGLIHTPSPSLPSAPSYSPASLDGSGAKLLCGRTLQTLTLALARPRSPALGQSSLRGPKLWQHETTGTKVNTTFCLIR